MDNRNKKVCVDVMNALTKVIDKVNDKAPKRAVVPGETLEEMLARYVPVVNEILEGIAYGVAMAIRQYTNADVALFIDRLQAAEAEMSKEDEEFYEEFEIDILRRIVGEPLEGA